MNNRLTAAMLLAMLAGSGDIHLGPPARADFRPSHRVKAGNKDMPREEVRARARRRRQIERGVIRVTEVDHA